MFYEPRRNLISPKSPSNQIKDRVSELRAVYKYTQSPVIYGTDLADYNGMLSLLATRSTDPMSAAKI